MLQKVTFTNHVPGQKGKQTTAAMATELWQQLPSHIKDLSTYNFPKTLKEYLLAEQLTY